MSNIMVSPTNADGIASALAASNSAVAGLTQSYLEESRDRSPIIAILCIATLTTLILSLRCYARFFVQKQFGLDDLLALLTMLPYLSFITLCLILIRLGSGRHIEFIEAVLDNDTTNVTEVLDFAAHILYTSALFICRLSGLAFYHRIGDRHTKLSKIINGAAVFLCLAFIPQIVLLITHCRPITGYWPYAWQAEVNNYTCLTWGTVYVTNSGLSLVCDLVIFVIPAAIISMVKRSTSGKIKLSLVLFPGVLVIAISSVRVFLVVRGQWETDQSWVYDPFLAIENAEIGGTLIALSVPALKPLAGRVSSSYIFASSKKYYGSSRTPKDEKLIVRTPPRSDEGLWRHRRYRSGQMDTEREFEMGDDVVFKGSGDQRSVGYATSDEAEAGLAGFQGPEFHHQGILKRTEVQTTVVERDDLSP